VILLFVSPSFIESKYCYEVEGQEALRRHETGRARVIPIILRPCLWERSPFGKLQALPHDARPVSRWPDRDEACLNVARGVLAVVDQVLSDRSSTENRASTSSSVSGQKAPSSSMAVGNESRRNDDVGEDGLTVLERFARWDSDPNR
jgi:hypothetical protein